MLNSRTVKMITILIANMVIKKKISKEIAALIIREISDEIIRWNPTYDPNYLLNLFQKKIGSIK